MRYQKITMMSIITDVIAWGVVYLKNIEVIVKLKKLLECQVFLNDFGYG